MKFGDKSLNIYGTKDCPVFVMNEICDILYIDKKDKLAKQIKRDYKMELNRGGRSTPPVYNG